MKRLMYFLPVLFLLYCIEAPAQEKKKIVIATAPGTTVDEDIKGLFIDELGKGLTKSGRYTVIQNRKEYAEILGEEISFQDLVDDEQHIEVGGAKGADYACYVTIRKISNNFHISCKLLDLRTNESIGDPFSMSTKKGEDDLIDVAVEMATKLTRGGDITEVTKDYITMPNFCQNEHGDVVAYDIGIYNEKAMNYPEAEEHCKLRGQGWRLPTKEELLCIYSKRSQLEAETKFKPFNNADYWSLSKRNNYDSYIINFSNGKEDAYSKNIKNTFRCIRCE